MILHGNSLCFGAGFPFISPKSIGRYPSLCGTADRFWLSNSAFSCEVKLTMAIILRNRLFCFIAV